MISWRNTGMARHVRWSTGKSAVRRPGRIADVPRMGGHLERDNFTINSCDDSARNSQPEATEMCIPSHVRVTEVAASGGEDMARVLVIDDDPAISRMMSLTLRSAGFEVKTALNGAVGLEQVEAQSPEVIVLDLEMPVLDGRGFYRELRRKGYTMPVLIVSANGAKAACRELDANDSLAKPFAFDELTSKLERLLPA